MLLLVSTPALAQNFHNQVHAFVDHQNVSAHAAQMGYDYTTQSDAHTYGLKRIFYGFSPRVSFLSVRDNWYKAGQSTISNSEYDEYVCIRDNTKTDPLQRYAVVYANSYDGTHVQVTFWMNVQRQSVYNATFSWLDSNVGWSNYDAAFIDQIDHNFDAYTWNGSGDITLFSTWTTTSISGCQNPSADYTFSQGYTNYRQSLITYFRNKGFTISGNVWNISGAGFGQEVATNAPVDHYYNESGINNSPSTWGLIPPNSGSVDTTFPPGCYPSGACTGRNFSQVFAAAGVAAADGAWFGVYGEDWYWIANGDGTMATGMNAVQLLRAIPNWDNLTNAGNRSWDGAVYRSSQSYADQIIVYSRHPKTGKLFVVFRSQTAVLSLRTSETVVSVWCVDDIFIEREDCASHVALSGSEVRLTESGQLNEGYIVEVR